MIIYLLSIIFFSTRIRLINSEIIQLQFLSRHCDRTPINNIILPTCPIDICSLLNISTGILTPLGEYQCFHLGLFIHDRYLSHTSKYFIKEISKSYRSYDYFFKSSAVRRTIRSAYSIGKGLFPIDVGEKIDIYPYIYSLPNGSVSIPIFSIEMKNDRIFLEDGNCRKIEENVKIFYESKEGKMLIEKYMTMTNKIYEVTGLNYTLPTNGRIGSIVRILKDHKLLCKNIEEVEEMLNHVWKVSNSVYNRREIVGKLKGGGFLEEVVNNMESFIKTGSIAKFIHFSGHDSSILAVLYALFVFEDYPELIETPNFGAALFFELERNDNEYYVRVQFKNGWNADIVELKLRYLGCEDICKFETFKRVLYEKSIPDVKDWCEKCGNVESEFCLKYLLVKLTKLLQFSIKI